MPFYEKLTEILWVKGPRVQTVYLRKTQLKMGNVNSLVILTKSLAINL